MSTTERLRTIQEAFDNAHHYAGLADAADSRHTAHVLRAMSQNVTDRAWADIFALLPNVPGLSTETGDDGHVTISLLA